MIFSTISSALVHEAKLLPYFAFFLLLEIWRGIERPLTWKDRLHNWRYYPIWILGVVLTAVLIQTPGYVALTHSIQRFRLTFNLGHPKPIVYYLCTLLLFDGFYYWFHRLQHTRALWPQHFFHHSDRYMNASTAFRHHWLENLVRIPIVDLPQLLIGIAAVLDPGMSLLERLLVFVILQAGLLSHANLRIGFGPLTVLFTSPQYHRIHHSIEKRHRGKNFAAYFPIYDWLFGTYYRPANDEYPRTGVYGSDAVSRSFSGLTLFPFRIWTRRLRMHFRRWGGTPPWAIPRARGPEANQ